MTSCGARTKVIESVWFMCKICKICLENREKMINHLDNAHFKNTTNDVHSLSPGKEIKASDSEDKRKRTFKRKRIFTRNKVRGSPSQSISYKRKTNSKPTLFPRKITRKFQCNACTRKYQTQFHLEVHQRTHTGERPFSCKVCLKAFAQETNYKNHMRIHTGQRPFKCKFCGKGFTQVTNVIFHERIHTGEKPYSCRNCGKKFAQTANCSTHEKKCIIENKQAK